MNNVVLKWIWFPQERMTVIESVTLLPLNPVSDLLSIWVLCVLFLRLADLLYGRWQMEIFLVLNSEHWTWKWKIATESKEMLPKGIFCWLLSPDWLVRFKETIANNHSFSFLDHFISFGGTFWSPNKHQILLLLKFIAKMKATSSWSFINL